MLYTVVPLELFTIVEDNKRKFWKNLRIFNSKYYRWNYFKLKKGTPNNNKEKVYNFENQNW